VFPRPALPGAPTVHVSDGDTTGTVPSCAWKEERKKEIGVGIKGSKREKRRPGTPARVETSFSVETV